MSVLEPFRLGTILIDLSVVCLAVALLIAVPPKRKRDDDVLLFTLGVMADAWFYWLVRKGNEISAQTLSGTDPKVWISSVTSLAVVLLVMAAIRPRKIAFSPQKLDWTLSAAFLAGYLTLVLAFRFSYWITFEIPNEDRSLIVAGVEVHHLIFGVFLLGLATVLARYSLYFGTHFGGFCAGAAIGTITDQLGYLLQYEVSDLSYNSPFSWSVPIFYLLYFVFVFMQRKDR
ncbi:MAG: hypothetical protein ACFHX7_21945 [Pseudomonadota bacterium]